MNSGTGITAVEYPYDVPTESYVFDPRSGRTERAEEEVVHRLSQGRSAVLAIGSNSAPSQLYQKFHGRQGMHDPFPVIRAALSGHDVVYSAHLSLYGAVPATLARSEGTAVDVFITFLTDAQLQHMHATERIGDAYRVVQIPPRLITSTADLPNSLIAYESVAGPLLLDGQPCALSAIQAKNRRFPALTEEEVLLRIAAAFQLSVQDFLARATDIESPFRTKVEQWMLRARAR